MLDHCTEYGVDPVDQTPLSENESALLGVMVVPPILTGAAFWALGVKGMWWLLFPVASWAAIGAAMALYPKSKS
jgi:hypothetical protein